MEKAKKEFDSKYLSTLGLFSLALGSSVGWGALIMPGSTFLPKAGPLGTLFGIIIGAIIMTIIGFNYHHLMQKYPENGGAYTYVKNEFGHDHGFICGWFLGLSYAAIIWANSSALSLLIKYIFGDIFQFGFHYNILGYEIYFGEILLPLLSIILLTLLCLGPKKLLIIVQTSLVFIMILGILVLFIGALTSENTTIKDAPLFAADEKYISQIMSIIVLSPWAFIGFEAASNSASEIKDTSRNKIKLFISISLAIALGALCYIALTELSVSALPEGYATWKEYIADLPSNDGAKSVPTLFSAIANMGSFGKSIFFLVAIGATMTGVIGNTISASRVLQAMSSDHEKTKKIASHTNRFSNPTYPILLISCLSIIMVFLGRSTISLIVDVTTVGATIIYAYTSLTAFKSARRDHNIFIQTTGITGAIIATVLSFYFFIPNMFSGEQKSTIFYMLLIVWCMLGVFFFLIMFKNDQERRYGHSILVWLSLFLFIFISSILWARQSSDELTNQMMDNISNYIKQLTLDNHGTIQDSQLQMIDVYSKEQDVLLQHSLLINSIIQMAIIIVSLSMMFLIYILIQKRERDSFLRSEQAMRDSAAKSSFLSNMSHDLRTPMNAITGYTNIALQEKDHPEKVHLYLQRINQSSKHLLNLINDILDMSKIEKQKLELFNETVNLKQVFMETYDLFSLQMKDKKIDFRLDVNIQNEWISCDHNRLDRVLLNLLSNAYKFTPENGQVIVTLTQLPNEKDDIASYEIHVKDTGIGMSEEFVKNIYDTFQREKRHEVNNIQGTGLGMAITKSIIDLMNGKIEINTEKGKGTEFIISVSFPISYPSQSEKEDEIRFDGMTVLLAEDNEINQEIASFFLQSKGFKTILANNGKEALDIVSKAKAGDIDILITDINMPLMNGLEVTKAIRKMEGNPYQNLPILALSAHVFKEEIDQYLEAGMDGCIAKPIEVDEMVSILRKILNK